MFYNKQTYSNKSSLKRISHNSRYQKSVDILLDLFKSKKINLLDFGCGDGYFLSLLHNYKKKWKLSGYDPNKKAVNEMKKLLLRKKIKVVSIFNEYKKIKKKYNVITCFETLEHFNSDMQLTLLKQMREKLSKNGTILISVPIEIYLSGFLKGLYRSFINQKNNRANFKNLFKILFNIKIQRPKTNKYISSHVGFDYLKLTKIIKDNNFQIFNTFYTPFAIFGPILNSQVFMILKIKKNNM